MLHSKLKSGLMGVVCAMLASCGSPDSLKDSVDYLPVQMKDGGNWSIIDPKGKIVVDGEFSNEPTAAVDGIFSVYEDGGYSIYNVKKPKKAVVEDLASVGVYYEDVIPATKKDSRITILDKNGKVKATLNPVSGKEIVACRSYFTEGLLAVMDDEYNWGYVNKSGEVKIKPAYSGVTSFVDGRAIAIKDDSQCVIDKSGKVVFKIKEDYSILDSFIDGLIPVRDTEKDCYGYIDKKGRFTKVNGDFRGFKLLSDEYFAYQTDDYLWGVKTIKGENVIKANYESISMLADGNFLVEKEGGNRNEWLVINKKGETKVEFEDYRSVNGIDSDNFAFIGRGRSKYSLVDKKGKQIGDDDYADININPMHGDIVRSDYSGQ